MNPFSMASQNRISYERSDSCSNESIPEEEVFNVGGAVNHEKSPDSKLRGEGRGYNDYLRFESLEEKKFVQTKEKCRF